MLTATIKPTCVTRIVHVPAYGAALAAELVLPNSPQGIVVFVDGAKFSSAYTAERGIAHAVEHAGFATLRLDLLTPDEELVDNATRGLANDVALLSRRLSDTIDWMVEQPTLSHLPIGLFVTGSAAGAALVASAVEQDRVAAIVSTASRIERASPVLTHVTTPTLLIVAGDDPADAQASEAAFRQMRGVCEMVLMHGQSSHLDFAAAADEIGRHALGWFERYLVAVPIGMAAPNPA